MSRRFRLHPGYAGAVLLRFRHRTLPRQTARPHLMGIVNVTPDSFYDDGATATADRRWPAALARRLRGARP